MNGMSEWKSCPKCFSKHFSVEFIREWLGSDLVGLEHSLYDVKLCKKYIYNYIY